MYPLHTTRTFESYLHISNRRSRWSSLFAAQIRILQSDCVCTYACAERTAVCRSAKFNYTCIFFYTWICARRMWHEWYTSVINTHKVRPTVQNYCVNWCIRPCYYLYFAHILTSIGLMLYCIQEFICQYVHVIYDSSQSFKVYTLEIHVFVQWRFSEVDAVRTPHSSPLEHSYLHIMYVVLTC